MCVNNVKFGDAWYVTEEDSAIKSLGFSSTSTHTIGETAVALARVGDGKLSYIGVVNGEEGSSAVVLAMCGFSGSVGDSSWAYTCTNRRMYVPRETESQKRRVRFIYSVSGKPTT